MLMSGVPVASSAPQPFLKWAGGKRALLGEIRSRTPIYSGTYFEPFLGAGAVLFDQGIDKRKIVSDYNSDLIELYEVIRDKPSQLLKALKSHVNTAQHFYEVRAWDRDPNFYKRSKVERAARFIYLNKTGYNGLYRVNRAGQNNVPFGGQVNPDWIQDEILQRVNVFLNACDGDGERFTRILSGDYRDALASATSQDWVYLDPPYASTFTHYQSGGFTLEHQSELRDEIMRLTEIGVPVLLSNSDVPVIRALYSDRDYFEIETVTVRRAIGAKVSSRGLVREAMINNYFAVGI